jgi:hypothetical protein
MRRLKTPKKMNTKKRNISLITSLVILAVVSLFLWNTNWDKQQSRDTAESDSTELPLDEGAAAANTPEPATTAALATTEPKLSAFTEWQSIHLPQKKGAVPAIDDLVMAEGKRLARARAERMLELMKRDPKRALESSLSWSDWVALPAEIQGLVERPFSDSMDFEQLSDCRPKGLRTTPVQLHFIEHGDDHYDAHVYGRRTYSMTKNALPLQGIALEDHMAVWETPLQILNDADLQAARSILPDGNSADTSWLSGNALGANKVSALLGGKIYHFESEEEVAVVAAAIKKAEIMPGPDTVRSPLAAGAGGGGGNQFDPEEFGGAAGHVSIAWTHGIKQQLILRIVYSGQSTNSHPYPTDPADLSQATAALNRISYRKAVMTITWSPVLVLPNNKSFYEGSGGHAAMRTAANAAATAGGLNPATYDRVCYWTSSTSNSNSGFPVQGNAFASIGGKESTFNGVSGARTSSLATHEFGHNFGCGHANAWAPYTGGFTLHDPDWFDPTRAGYDTQQGDYAIEHEEYGDIFDIMGPDSKPGVFPAGHFSMSQKAHLNWMDPSFVQEVTTTGNYRIYRFDHEDARVASGRKLALNIPTASGENIWVGIRRGISDNSDLSNGAYITWEQEGGNRHRLINTNAFSNDVKNAALGIGESFIEPGGKFRITPIDNGGSGVDQYMNVEVTILDRDPVAAAKNVFEFYTDSALTTPGLVGSYVNDLGNIFRFSTSSSDDFRSSTHGTRTDLYPGFLKEGTLNGYWGDPASVGILGWQAFAVQWDGYIKVNDDVNLYSYGTGGARFRASKGGTLKEASHLWLDGGNTETYSGWFSLEPGIWAIRIQYRTFYQGAQFVMAGQQAWARNEVWVDPLYFDFFFTNKGTFVEPYQFLYGWSRNWSIPKPVRIKARGFPLPAQTFSTPARLEAFGGTVQIGQ